MTQNIDIKSLPAGDYDELSLTRKSRDRSEFARQQEAEANKHKLEPEAADKEFQRLAFLNTFGSWEDGRTAEEIIEDIYASRTLSDSNDRL